MGNNRIGMDELSNWMRAGGILKARIQQLEAALEPFAKAARHEIEADALMSPEFRHGDYDNEYIVIQFGDLRRAASAQAIREDEVLP